MIIITILTIVIDNNSRKLFAAMAISTITYLLANSIYVFKSNLFDKLICIMNTKFIRMNLPTASIILKIGMINLITLFAVYLVASFNLKTSDETITLKQYVPKRNRWNKLNQLKAQASQAMSNAFDKIDKALGSNSNYYQNRRIIAQQKSMASKHC